MTDILPASETTDLPSLPQGWHVVKFAALADGTLAILGSTFDVRAMHIALWKAVQTEDEAQMEVDQMKVENPFRYWGSVPARIWTFDGVRLTEGPTFPLLTPYPKFDRFPDGRWLVSYPRSDGEPLGCILGADGTEVRRIQLGDGIEHVQIDEGGHVWVGWFDEGIYGNQGFMGDPTWSYPGLDEPPSVHGLAAFDEHGRVVALPPSEAHIADCCALNVAGRTAWACTYADFPVLSVTVGGTPGIWRTGLRGPKAIAVQPPYVLATGGYDSDVVGSGPGSDHVVLVRLDGEQGETVAEWRLPFKTHDGREVQLLSGRGDTLHAVRGGVWHRWRISDAMALDWRVLPTDVPQLERSNDPKIGWIMFRDARQMDEFYSAPDIFRDPGEIDPDTLTSSSPPPKGDTMSTVPNSVRHAEIRNKLRDRGSSLSEIARELDLAPATVTIVSQSHRRSHRVQSAIAAKLGVEPKDLFPERYPDDDGTTS